MGLAKMGICFFLPNSNRKQQKSEASKRLSPALQLEKAV